MYNYPIGQYGQYNFRPSANKATVLVPENDKHKERKTLRAYLAEHAKIKNEEWRIFCAEFLAEMIYVTVGLSSIAQYKLSSVYNPYLSGPLALYFGYSVGAMFAVLIAGKVSGPNITTAISFARLVAGDISIWRFFVYASAQFLGAFVGALWTWIIYLEAIKVYPNGFHSIDTARIFSTYPTGQLSYVEEFFQQVVATAIVVMVFLAITDKKNGPLTHGLCALFVGFIILMKTCAFSMTQSNSVNPARDFSPRLFTFIAGWGSQTFTFGNYWFWIPIASPLVGSAIGTFLYLLIISSQLN